MSAPAPKPAPAPAPKPALTSTSADLLEPPSRLAGWTIQSISGLCGLALAWSYLTPVAEIAAGTGKVIPDRYVQTVQSVEGGYVAAIYAKSGDFVKKDEIILRLDPSAPGANKEELVQQIAGLRASAARLQALQSGKPLDFASDLKQLSERATVLAKSQYEADQAEQASALASLQSAVDQKQGELAETRAELSTVTTAEKLAREEFASLKQLYKEGAASRAEVLAAESKHNELKGNRERLKLALPRLNAAILELSARREERRNTFMAKVAGDLAETETRIAALQATLEGQSKKLERTEIRAPVAGIVKTVNAVSLGQAIKPFDPVAEIVPESDTVLIQARIRPEDIGFVTKGHPAIIKLSAYDYSIFGALHGTLEKIAADSTLDERGNPYYAVDVRADRNYIERRGEKWPVKTGMTANVEIVTGDRTVFQYLTKPIHRMATMALRER